MPLPIEFKDIDTSHEGLPFVVWKGTSVGALDTLDSSQAGLPFYAPTSTVNLAAGTNTLTVSAPTATIHVGFIATTNLIAIIAPSPRVVGWYRVYPGLRDERTAFTALGTHIKPEFSYQDPNRIP